MAEEAPIPKSDNENIPIETRFERQMAESHELLEESAGLLETALSKIERAAQSLAKYGAPPFGDLEP